MCGRPVALAQEKLDVVALSARDAGLLQVEPGSLALSLECVSFDVDGRPIEHAYSLTPANQVDTPISTNRHRMTADRCSRNLFVVV